MEVLRFFNKRVFSSVRINSWSYKETVCKQPTVIKQSQRSCNKAFFMCLLFCGMLWNDFSCHYQKALVGNCIWR